jgi:hypothetical protein
VLESGSEIINLDSSINLESRRAKHIVVDIPEIKSKPALEVPYTEDDVGFRTMTEQRMYAMEFD